MYVMAFWNELFNKSSSYLPEFNLFTWICTGIEHRIIFLCIFLQNVFWQYDQSRQYKFPIPLHFSRVARHFLEANRDFTFTWNTNEEYHKLQTGRLLKFQIVNLCLSSMCVCVCVCVSLCLLVFVCFSLSIYVFYFVLCIIYRIQTVYFTNVLIFISIPSGNSTLLLSLCIFSLVEGGEREERYTVEWTSYHPLEGGKKQ